jgi:hypothetical protein
MRIFLLCVDIIIIIALNPLQKSTWACPSNQVRTKQLMGGSLAILDEWSIHRTNGYDRAANDVSTGQLI